MISTKSVQNINKQKAEKLAKEQGWELHNIRMLTNHEDDHDLMVVMSYIPNKKEWVVHIYNATFEGFYEGYYTKDKLYAIDKFWSKQ